MTQKLSVSRAARLIGVPRGALRKKILDGELVSHEGMIAIADLLAAFPAANIDEGGAYERVTRIKEEAFGRRVRERLLPDAHILSERMFEQSRELADVRAHLQRYHNMVVRLQQRIDSLRGASQGEAREALLKLDVWLEDELGKVLADTPAPEALTIMDDMLRVMSAHVIVQPSRREFFVEGADTLLEAALRAGLSPNYGCSNGNCGLCKTRVVSGQIRKVRPHDYVLSEAERLQGYALMCCNAAVSDLVIEALEANAPADIPEQSIVAHVKAVATLSDDVRLLHLQTPRSARLRFLAGQSVVLSVEGCDPEEHFIASCPCDDRNIQFHVRRDPDSAFAKRVFTGLALGDSIALRGPWGDFVLNEDSPRSLVFIAGDSGFAPIKSLIEHAMALDTAESMRLYWHASQPGGHYSANLCRSWADALDNFKYAALEGSAEETARQVIADCPARKDFDFYIAGPETFVGEVRERLLASGMPTAQIKTAGV